MMFEDRKDAGRKLAGALQRYTDEISMVLAIPRGGVEVGYEVARSFGVPLSLVMSRKLPFPDNPESGFGAVAEDGSLFMIHQYEKLLAGEEVDRIISEQKRVIKERISILRKNKPLPEIDGQIVVLVDDGIAMGSTMRVSIELCKRKNAQKIIVAVPVSGPETARLISGQVDDMVVLETPANFRSVSQVYRNWYDVTDGEVKDILSDL